MAVLGRVALKAFIDTNLDTNGANAITGAQLNLILNDLVDSLLNLTDDAVLLPSNIYRSGEFVGVAGVQKTVTLSTPLPVNVYDIFISDLNGLGWESITDKTTDDFKITPITGGTFVYLVTITTS